ncbi:unnamed protein product [Blumeria hordei]|uniref:Uncharacterized protein n=1 Tax=Blumeria hordei TaxID=2867405 RepID=A0A383UM66_BLUHO|nr:unnamed protein product [Blumeria hordei]
MRYLNITTAIYGLGTLSSVTAIIRGYICGNVWFHIEKVEYTSFLAKSVHDSKPSTYYTSFTRIPYPEVVDSYKNGDTQKRYYFYPILANGEEYMRQDDAGPYRVVMDTDWNVIQVVQWYRGSYIPCEVPFNF